MTLPSISPDISAPLWTTGSDQRPGGAAEDPPPTILEKMIDTVDEFNNSLDEQEIRRACRSILRRAQACIEARGGAFEYKMKKAEWAIEE